MARMKLASSNALIRSSGWNSHNGSDAEPPDNKKNYEALVLFDDFINHCQRDNQNAPPTWDFPKLETRPDGPGTPLAVLTGVSAAPPIVQRQTAGYNVTRNFDALILEGKELWHYVCLDGVRDNWQRFGKVSPEAFGSASLATGYNRNESFDGIPDLHAFVREGREGNEVWYYRLELKDLNLKDARNTPLEWDRVSMVTDKATGDPASIISGDENGRTIEVLVPEGRDLVHYYVPNLDFSIFGFPPLGISPFLKRDVVSRNCQGAAAFVELSSLYLHHTLQAMAAFVNAPLTSNPDFHALVPEDGGLRHYYRMNLIKPERWHQGVMVAEGVSGPGSMMETLNGQVSDGKPDLINGGKREFIIKNGNLDALLTIGDDLYFTFCEFVSLYDFKWQPPVKIV